jgi:hypothetical protein
MVAVSAGWPGSAARPAAPASEEALGHVGRAAAGKQLLQEGEILAARRRDAVDRVEDLAVLERVVGAARHDAVLVEIDRKNALIDDLQLLERHERSRRCEM